MQSESALDKVLVFSLKIGTKKLWRGLLLPEKKKKRKKKSEEMDSCMEKRIKFREEVLTKGASSTLPGDIKGAVFEG